MASAKSFAVESEPKSSGGLCLLTPPEAGHGPKRAMTVNYTGGSRQGHRRVARRSQLDATGAPSYRVTAPSRSGAIHLASLRNTLKRSTGVGKRSTSSAAAASDMPRFDFSFAQQENLGQQPKRRENASAEEMMRILYTDDAYDPNNPLERAAPPSPNTSFATFSDQRRRVLATGDWAGLGSSSSNWRPARPAADLALSWMKKRPRTRTPSPEYTPLTPPPRGGFLRGSSVDLATDDDDDDHGLRAGEEDEETTFETVGDYSSEIEDAVILLPERGHPGATQVYRSKGDPGSVDPLAFLANQGRGSLTQTEARKTTSIALKGAHLQWSARKRLAAATRTSHRNVVGYPPPRLRPPRPQEPPASLAKVEETEEDQDLLRDLSGVRGLSLEDQSYEPTTASPSPSSEQPQPHDSLELFDFSPHRSTADENFGGVRVTEEDEQQHQQPVVPVLEIKLEAGSVDPQQQQVEPRKETKTVTITASPTAQPAVEPPPSASAFTALHEYVPPSSPQDGFPSSSPAAAATAEWDLEAMWRDMQGFLPAPPDLAPIHHLAHLRDEAFALHESDELATIPTFAALEGKVLLVSEQMGLGCEALTAEQADELVKREMAMRGSGVMPIEWYSNEEEEEPSEEPCDTGKRPQPQQLGKNGAGGQGADESHNDDDEEGWDPDAEDVDQRGTALPGRRILNSGLLFASDDDTGILEA